MNFRKRASDDVRNAIKEMLNTDKTQKEIARIAGCSESFVYQVKIEVFGKKPKEEEPEEILNYANHKTPEAHKVVIRGNRYIDITECLLDDQYTLNPAYIHARAVLSN